MDQLVGKTISSILDDDTEARAHDTEFYTIVITFTDGTRLTLNTGS